MQQIANVWESLTSRRKMVVVLATVAMFTAVLTLSRMAAAPSMSLLYAGLESGPAGEVVRALEQRGVTYDVRGGAIFVDSTKRDELRMTLASEGLPANGAKGYELLDTLSGFGTTSQMFDAAYWRAKEGELSRTIMSNPSIASARVHLATTGSNPFQREVRPTGSVSVTTNSGALSAQHARALKYLVASAVAGLAPEDVAVIDSQGNLINGAEDAARAPDAEDKAAVLRQRVQRLVEASVGYGNAVVEVSVETETDTESIRERRFDPEGRVAISTDTEERSSQSTDTGGGGDVTVASNLPDGDAGGGTDSSQSQNSETRERVNYEVSETEREIVRGPGAIKRLSVAVLVNGTMVTDDTGQTVFQPMPDEEIKDLRDLVASAVPFDAERGDTITIKSLPFEPLPSTGESAMPGFLESLHLDLMSLIQLAVLALVSLLLGLFVIRPILTRDAEEPLALPGNQAAAPGATAAAATTADPLAGNLPALTGEIDDGGFDFPVMGGIDGDLPGLGSDTGAEDDPVERLRNMIGERQEETIEILRSWLDEDEEQAG